MGRIARIESAGLNVGGIGTKEHRGIMRKYSIFYKIFLALAIVSSAFTMSSISFAQEEVTEEETGEEVKEEITEKEKRKEEKKARKLAKKQRKIMMNEHKKKTKMKPKDFKIDMEDYEASKDRSEEARNNYYETEREFREKYRHYEMAKYREERLKEMPDYQKSKYRIHSFGQLDFYDTFACVVMGKDRGYFNWLDKESWISKYIPSTITITARCNPTKMNVPGGLSEFQDLFSHNYSFYEAPLIMEVMLGRNQTFKSPKKKASDKDSERKGRGSEYSRTRYGLEMGYSNHTWTDFATDFFSIGMVTNHRSMSERAYLYYDNGRSGLGGLDSLADFHWKYVNDNDDRYIDFYVKGHAIYNTYKNFFKAVIKNRTYDTFGFLVLLPVRMIPIVFPFISNGYSLSYRGRWRKIFDKEAVNEKVLMFGPIFRVPWPINRIPFIKEGYFSTQGGIDFETMEGLFNITFTVPFTIS